MPEPILHHLGPFDVPGFSPRMVRVCVPPRRSHAAPPVLYLFDGQNLFHDEPSFAGGWHLHTTVARIAARRERAPIVVGIDHGGHERIGELSPFPTRMGHGRLEGFLEWMVRELVPRIGHAFGTSSDPADIGIGGSSMGGLAALYAHFRHPYRFGRAMSMSPSLQIGQGALFDWIASQARPFPSRIYIDAGALEVGGHLLRATASLAQRLAERGYDAQSLKFVAAKRGAHNEKAWRRRAPGAIRFLFGNRRKR
jgi:predicted alpha/beta superfamily hydrolase